MHLIFLMCGVCVPLVSGVLLPETGSQAEARAIHRLVLIVIVATGVAPAAGPLLQESRGSFPGRLRLGR